MIHSGAVVAAGISQGRGTTLPFDLHVGATRIQMHTMRRFLNISATIVRNAIS
jgi:uncharacterized protein YbbC (DUF1343 family)